MKEGRDIVVSSYLDKGTGASWHLDPALHIWASKWSEVIEILGKREKKSAFILMQMQAILYFKNKEGSVVMKITSVDVMMLKPNLSDHQKSVNPWHPVFCKINTDEGIYGYGEAAMAYGVGGSAAFGMIKDLSKLIIGMDPLDNEVIWEKLYKTTFWGQNGGAVVFTGISAIDIALWDIKGKYFNVPVYKLLGGKKRDKLRTYASQLQCGWADNVPEYEIARTAKDYFEATKKAVAEGFDAVKVDFFTFDQDGRKFSSNETTTLLKAYYLDLVEERAAAVREALGKSGDLIVENHSRTDAQSALQIAKRIEKYNIFFMEEPNTPTPKMTKYFAENCNIPLASGERIYSRWEFAPYFENCSLQIIQPDIGNCGGITEVKKICDMAYIYDVGVQAHTCATPFSTAVALQLETVIPNFCIHEHHAINRLTFNRELCLYDLQPVDGYFTVPEIPGIGNELSEFALKTADKVTVS